MTHGEQQQITEDFISAVKAILLSKIDRLPAEWNGIELREWVADEFAAHTAPSLTGQRRAEYHNSVIVNNL